MTSKITSNYIKHQNNIKTIVKIAKNANEKYITEKLRISDNTDIDPQNSDKKQVLSR